MSRKSKGQGVNNDHISLGKQGEDHAVSYLRQHGYRIKARNWRKPWGELDIVATKKRTWRKRTWVFVEVKTATERSHPLSKYPEVHVNAQFQRRLIRAAQSYLSEHNIPLDSDWQIDVIAVLVNPATGKMTTRHTERAVGGFT